jgi:hypothetical protein
MTDGGNVQLANAGHSLALSGTATLDMGGGDIVLAGGQGGFTFDGGTLQNAGTIDLDIPDGASFTPDASGNASHGRVRGNGSFVTGQVGNALSFDGNNDSVDFGYFAPMHDPGQFTMAMWFRRDADGGSATNHSVNNVLVANSDNSGNDNFEVGSEGSDLELYFDSGGGDIDGGGPDGGITNGQWHHLVVNYDMDRDDVSGGSRDVAEIWVDGSMVGSYTDPPNNDLDPAEPAETIFSLGMARVGSNNWGDFEGLIDEFAMWSRALTDGEITDLYTNGVGAVDDMGLEVYTPLDDFGGPVFAQDGGRIAPGAVDEIGVTTIEGDYLFNDGIYGVDVSGPANGENDLIDVAGEAYLDGLLDIALLDGHIPLPGDLHDVLTATDGITLGSGFGLLQPGSNYPYKYQLVDGGMTLQLWVDVPEPASVLLLLAGGLALVGCRRRRSRRA